MRAVLSILALCVGMAAHAAEFQVPPLTGPVVDGAGMFRASTAQSLDRFLRGVRDRGGAQIQVATVPDLGGLSIEEASIRMTDKWKLGMKKDDRGLLLLFAPKERKVRIEVGQGLEGNLPDVVANRIIREVIVPRMREGSADRAVLDGVMAIVHYTDPQILEDGGEAAAAPRGEARSDARAQKIANGAVIFILIFLFVILPIFSRPWRLALWAMLLSRGSGSGWGGGGGGGGWGGGSGGGGWSGGGGGFSGGGSSGSW